jgi:TonB family protein
MSSTVIDAGCQSGLPLGKSALKAALLSFIPGLGQLYNGEKRKGILFLDATVVNFLLLLLIVFNEPIVGGITEICSQFHVKANVSVIEAVRHAHLGSPASWVLFSLMALFGMYAIRDAYTFANLANLVNLTGRKSSTLKYPNHLIGLTETSSGVYLAHFALLITCLWFAACFTSKAPIERNSVVIEFIPEQAPTDMKPPADTERQSIRDSIDSGRHDFWRDIVAPEAACDPIEPSAASAAAPSPNNVRPQPAIDPIPGAPQPNLQELVALTTPTIRPTPVPSHVEANKPTAGDPMPSQAKPAMVKYISGNKVSDLPLATNHPDDTQSPQAVPDGATSGGASPNTVPHPKNPATGGNIAAPGPVATMKHPSSVDNATPVAVLPGGNPSGSAVSNNSAMPTTKPGQGATVTGDNDNAMAPVSNDRGVLGNTRPNAVDGPDSLASKGVDPEFSAFMGQLAKIIKKHWYPPRTGSSNASVMFELRKDGTMRDLRMSQSSNSTLIDGSALAAVRNAQPFFPVLPKGAPEAVDIEFTFEYNNVIIY